MQGPAWARVVEGGAGNTACMSDPTDHTLDPVEVEPTNNSLGEPVDMNKVEELEDEAREGE